jgi:hypothetical protein
MGVAEDLKNDLAVAMTMAAFVGAAWYICVELNVRLWFSYLRKRGLYFWAVFVGTQGVLTQPLLIVWEPLHALLSQATGACANHCVEQILADFGQIKNPYVAFIFIYISWWMLVVPQSVVLYSRLHLISSNTKHNRYVLYMIIFTTIFISLPTMGLGTAAQASRIPHLVSANLIWDRVQVTIFFLQETVISIMYIVETRRVLLNRALLGQNDGTIRQVMRHLIYTNMLVVFLDCSLLGMSYSPYFYVQAAFKPCVYGVKLRIEFSILNRLVTILQGSLAHLKNGSNLRIPTLSENESSAGTSVGVQTYPPPSDRQVAPPSVHHLTNSSMGDFDGANGSGSGIGETKISKPRFLLRKPAKPGKSDKMQQDNAEKDDS